MTLGGFQLGQGNIEQAAVAWQEAQEIFRRQGNRSRLQDAIHVFGMLYLGTGEFDRALALPDDAYAANQAPGSPTEIIALGTTRSTIHNLRGEYEQGFREFVLQGSAEEERVASQMRVCMRQQLAWLDYDLGAYDKALEECRLAFGYPDGGQASFHIPTFTLLTLIHLARGDLMQAEDAVTRGRAHVDRNGNLYPEWWEALPFPLAEGEWALAQGDIVAAAGCAEYLLEKFTMLRMRHLLPAVLDFRARVALAQGERTSAHRDLSAALELSDSIGAHRELWRICRALADLEAAQGNKAAAKKLRARARSEMAHVLEHAGSPQLRASFLARTA